MPLTKSEKDLQVSTQRRPAAENAAMGTLSAPAVSAFQLKADEEDQIQLKSTVQFEMEEEEVLQGKFILQRAESVDEEEPLQMKKPAANQTGLPDQLKSGIENLSGHSLDDVKVHYNSASPAQLNAHAYAQGTDIHVAPGQEQHLPHEAWHVVQQKQGRVQPTMQLKDSIVMNDDPGLEEEADLMGAKALQMKKEESGLQASQPQKTEGSQHLISLQPSAIVPLVQRVILHEDDTPMTDEELNALIGSYSDKIQNIIRDMHLEEGGGFSLEQAIEIASELANETEESPEDDIPDYARELLGEDIASEDDIDYVDEELMSSSSVKKPRKKKEKEQKGSFKTLSTFKGASPRKSGDFVNIEREEVGHSAGRFRTKSVSGMVKPTPTKGRPSAPESDSGPKVGVKWKEVGSKTTRNTGMVDAQKGHIMALELGGPDIPENIVPQWAQWQSNGVWRQAEKAILARAIEEEKKGNKVKFSCGIKYKEYKNIAYGTIKGVFVPSGFRITITICNAFNAEISDPIVMFEQEQSQDITDDMLAYRTMDKLDENEDSSDSGSSDDTRDSESV